MELDLDASFKDLEGCIGSLHERSKDFKKSRDNEGNQSSIEQILESIWGSITFRTNDRRFRELVQSTKNRTQAQFIHQNKEGSNQINSISGNTNSRKDITKENTQSNASDSNPERRRLANSGRVGQSKHRFFNYVEIKGIGLFVHRDDFWYEIIRSMFVNVGRLESGNKSDSSNKNQNGSIEVRSGDSLDFGGSGKMEAKDPRFSKNNAEINRQSIPNRRFSDEKLCFQSQEGVRTITTKLQNIPFNIGEEDNRIRGILRGRRLNSGPQLHTDNHAILSSNLSQSIEHRCSSRGFEGSSVINYESKGDE
tara:strand:- start:762 stop:1688 length:927 start_codon:yes stop_codon:yes gene_type:complete